MHGHNLGVHHFSSGAHMILEILPCYLVGEVAHVDTLAFSSSTTTTISSHIPTTVTSPTSSSSSLRRTPAHLPILPHKNLPPHQIRIIESFHGPRGFLDGGVLDNAASLGSAVVPGQDVSAQDFARGGHVILEVAPGDGPGEVADVDALVLGYGVFGRVGFDLRLRIRRTPRRPQGTIQLIISTRHLRTGFRIVLTFDLLRTITSATCRGCGGNVDSFLIRSRGGCGCRGRCLFFGLFSFVRHFSQLLLFFTISLACLSLSLSLRLSPLDTNNFSRW
mmetsp:Transcript_24859/g.47632  ORF Transcript_24859/g.47632 Transcript_24859/m.47632 type:complete len:277 (-) Transcript_24859:99-929(-)